MCFLRDPLVLAWMSERESSARDSCDGSLLIGTMPLDVRWCSSSRREGTSVPKVGTLRSV